MKLGFLLFLALNIIGIIYTLYLTELTLQAKIACPLNSFISCEKILNSEYSYFLGIPLALYGTLGFLGLLILYFYKKLPYLIWGILGLIIIIILQFIQIFILQAYCLYCTISHVLFIASFVLGYMLRLAKF
jgi:Predicted membrane protein